MKEIAVIIIGASCIAAVATFLSHSKHRSLTSGALSLLLALLLRRLFRHTCPTSLARIFLPLPILSLRVEKTSTRRLPRTPSSRA